MERAFDACVCAAPKFIIYQNYSAHFALPTNVNQINFPFRQRRLCKACETNVKRAPCAISFSGRIQTRIIIAPEAISAYERTYDGSMLVFKKYFRWPRRHQEWLNRSAVTVEIFDEYSSATCTIQAFRLNFLIFFAKCLRGRSSCISWKNKLTGSQTLYTYTRVSGKHT